MLQPARRIGAVVLSWMCVPAAALADPAIDQGRAPAFSTGEVGSSSSPAGREERVRGWNPETEEVEVGGFCDGGGGGDPLEEVQALLDENRPGMARARLGRILREGLQEWDRPRAFGMAGEIALRLGAAGRAVAWYRQAEALGEEPADPTMVLGFAVALLRSGRRADAGRKAAGLVEDACASAEGAGDPLTCYGARLVLALSATDREARAAELERARTVRAQNPEYDETFVDLHRMLPRLPRAALRVASSRQ